MRRSAGPPALSVGPESVERPAYARGWVSSSVGKTDRYGHLGLYVGPGSAPDGSQSDTDVLVLSGPWPARGAESRPGRTVRRAPRVIADWRGLAVKVLRAAGVKTVAVALRRDAPAASVSYSSARMTMNRTSCDRAWGLRRFT